MKRHCSSMRYTKRQNADFSAAAVLSTVAAENKSMCLYIFHLFQNASDRNSHSWRKAVLPRTVLMPSHLTHGLYVRNRKK